MGLTLPVHHGGRLPPHRAPTLAKPAQIAPAVRTAKPRLLDQVRDAIRTRHYSYRTEEAYVGWIKRFIFFHHKRHPAEMGPPEITQFLTALAVERHVSASTQNQALAAVLFLYQQVLGCDPGWLADIVRAKRAERLPVVLTRPEVQALLAALDGIAWIMAMLLYGSGLRLMEMSATACEGHRLRPRRDSGARRQGEQACPEHCRRRSCDDARFWGDHQAHDSS